MDTGLPLLINWVILHSMSVRMRTSPVPWTVSIETDPKGREAYPPGTFPWCYREASLKHLTFKTVFLLALGSGKRRSEIHAWQHKNIRHQSDWSKVSLFPSPSFLSKNQLAKEGPESVAPVVIPALAPTLDRSLKSDKPLCPVRGLALLFGQNFRDEAGQTISFCLLQERLQQRHLTCHYLLMDQADCDPMLRAL